jgi:trans-aconitate methyltransferase
LWNFEYRWGRWSYLDEFDGSSLVDLIEQYHTCGAMLDLGCGTGKNFNPRPTFTYLGVDISLGAIRTAELLRRPNAKYVVADIFEYVPAQKYDVILMREVLYYLPLPAVRTVLGRMTNALTRDGIIIIQIWNTDIHQAVIDAVLQSPLVASQRIMRQDGSCTLVMSRGPVS